MIYHKTYCGLLSVTDWEFWNIFFYAYCVSVLVQSGKVQGPKSQVSEASQQPNKNFNSWSAEFLKIY